MEPIQLKLEAFEGPLDLLLHLTKKMEVDLHDIPIAEITQQYMETLHSWQEESLEIAGEYLVMASTLLAIKSKWLLPAEMVACDLEDEGGEVDPREALERQLVEYRAFKEVAATLQEFELERSRYFTKEATDLAEYTKQQMELAPNRYSTISLYLAFHGLLEKQVARRPVQTTIEKESITIEERMEQLAVVLQQKKASGTEVVLFEEFVAPGARKSEIVTTFLAVLELIKKEQLLIQQEENYCSIGLIWK